MQTFHFIRPDWLWALLPMAVLGWLALRARGAVAAEGWARHVDSHLLQHLAIGGAQARRKPWVPLLALLLSAATILGVAGPTWQERQVPVFEGGTPTVVVLSLAQSMNADDLKPTRLKRAVHKLRDILERTQGDERGLIIYADTPFIAAPLTSDAQVIGTMLPELSTSLMPVLGNRLDRAITEATGMLERSGAAAGQIVVLADDAGNDPAASVAAAKAAGAAGYTVSVLGAGTEDGAVLKTARGQAITDASGRSVTTALARSDLERVAAAGGGAFSVITADGSDLNRLLPEDTGPHSAGDKQDMQTDRWVDMGYWLLLLPATLMPLLFRRGLVFALGLVAFGLIQPQGAEAGVLPAKWQDLWATPDQQGQTAFDSGAYDAAAAAFETPDWQGAAAYRGKDFAAAAQAFTDAYNQGNALASAGQLEAALQAYDTALEANPKDDDARFNRDLVAKLLEQQQNQQQQNQSSQDQQQAGQQDQQQAGQQDQQQAGQQDQQQAGQQDQQQAGQQDQQQASQQDQQQPGQQDQQQAGQQDQQQTGQQDQQQAGQQDQQQAGQQDQQQAGQPSQQDAQSDARPDSQTEQDRQSLAERLSDLLANQPQDAPRQDPTAAAAAASPKPLDQAIEQQLRRVPDDPSGLLRARIRQHYAQMQQGQQDRRTK